MANLDKAIKSAKAALGYMEQVTTYGSPSVSLACASMALQDALVVVHRLLTEFKEAQKRPTGP